MGLVRVSALVKMHGQLTRTAAVHRGDGLALINSQLAGFAEPIAVADRCRAQLHRSDVSTYLPDARFLDRAKIVHRLWLPEFAQARAAFDQLFEIAVFDAPPREPITHATAVAMLSVLFGALTKKKADDENATTLLDVSADLFNPVNDAVGLGSGLWAPVSKHPVVLALAIKRLVATSVFTPSPAELRSAMKRARDSLGMLARYAESFAELIGHADEMVFAVDRPAWDSAYTSVSANVITAMRDSIDDDDARVAALDQLAKAKLSAIEADADA
jgi:hypothetical protein